MTLSPVSLRSVALWALGRHKQMHRKLPPPSNKNLHGAHLFCILHKCLHGKNRWNKVPRAPMLRLSKSFFYFQGSFPLSKYLSHCLLNTDLELITIFGRFLEHCLFPEGSYQNKKKRPFDHPFCFEEEVESVLRIQGNQVCWTATSVPHDDRREGCRSWN